MALVESYTLENGVTKVEIYDDYICSEDKVQEILDEIGEIAYIALQREKAKKLRKDETA